MAQRRMFSLDIVDTDLFLDMPASTQNLYFHLGMRADDDGFVSSPKRITALVSCSVDDLKLLVAKGLIIPFDTGVCVIRDWKVNNYIQKDRYHETRYLAEKTTLEITESGSYFIVDTACIHNVSSMDTQVRQVKSSLDLSKENISDCGNASVHSSFIGDSVQAKSTLLTERFEQFWKAYPRKVGKGAALKVWVKLKPSEELLVRMLKAVEQQKRTAQWQRDSGQFIPHPSTWLNQERWEDEVTNGGVENERNQQCHERNEDFYTKGFHRADG